MESSRTRNGMKVRPTMNEFVSVQHYDSNFNHTASFHNYDGYYHKKDAFTVNPKWTKCYGGDAD